MNTTAHLRLAAWGITRAARPAIRLYLETPTGILEALKEAGTAILLMLLGLVGLFVLPGLILGVCLWHAFKNPIDIIHKWKTDEDMPTRSGRRIIHKIERKAWTRGHADSDR